MANPSDQTIRDRLERLKQITEPRGSSMTVLTMDSFASFLHVVVVHVQSGTNAQPGARVRVAKAALSQVAIDWNADFELLSVDGGISTLMVRGTVYSAHEVDLNMVELDIRSWPDVLDDIGTPGILVHDAQRADVAWSVVMTAGIEPDSVSVEGRSDLPFEDFQIVVPIYGLMIDQPTDLDRVQLLPSPGTPPMEVPPEFNYLAEPFRSCSGIAITRATAQTLFEAEQEGLAEIDFALGIALLIQRATHTSTDEPTFSPYSRKQTLAILGRYPVVAVLGRWGRRWLRGTKEVRPDHVLPPRPGVNTSRLPAFRDAPEALRQALVSWRRAIEEVDRVAKLLALWECLEFYTAETKLPRLFKPSEIRQLRERATPDLDPNQRDRVEELLAHLNSPPLMLRLEHAAESDGIALSVADLRVLKRLRGARNDISHGRRSTIPAHSDLRKGIGIANRLLVERLRNTLSPNELPVNTARQNADPSRRTNRNNVTGNRPRSTFTRDDKLWAEQAAEAMMLMMPHLEREELVPGPVRSRIQSLYADATEESLIVGMMRACDVAVKHLSKHFFDGALDGAATQAQMRLATIKSDDLATLGPEAYEDGARAIHLVTDAMIRNGPLSLEEFQTSKRVLLAFTAVLIALLFELAEMYGIPPARAAAQLGLEISTITPRDE